MTLKGHHPSSIEVSEILKITIFLDPQFKSQVFYGSGCKEHQGCNSS